MTKTEMKPSELVGKRIKLAYEEDLPEPDEITLEGVVTGMLAGDTSDESAVVLFLGDVKIDLRKWRLVD
jgi:hypothetical protein